MGNVEIVSTSRRHGVEALLSPRSVAIVGASASVSRIGGLIVALLRRHGFNGPIYPVNPRHETVHGLPCYPTLDAIPATDDIDLAVIFRPAEEVPAIAKACGERGVRGLVVISSGFAEVGEVGLQHELATVAAQYDLAVCGPNCAGIANFSRDFVAYGTTNFVDLPEINKGGVAILSASGGFGNTLFTYCQERGVGVSHLIGLGNEAVTSAADYLQVLVDDDSVRSVIGYVETIRDPVKFFEAADRAAERGKPIALLVAGRSEVGRQSIMTHTAALGGSPAALSGAFRQHGIIEVGDLDELADVALLFEHLREASVERVGVASLAGGGTSLIADVASDEGFTIPAFDEATVAALTEILPAIAVPSNPLDTTAGFGRDTDRLARTITVVADDPNVDTVIFFPIAAQVDYAQSIADTLAAMRESLSKPMIVIWTAGRHLSDGAWKTLRESGIPLFTRTRDAFRALRHVGDYHALASDARERQQQLRAHYPKDPEHFRRTLREVLEDSGAQFPTSAIVRSSEDAERAIETLPGPFAMKIVAQGVIHKTDVGGVRLDVPAERVATTYRELVADVANRVPGVVIEGVELQTMVPPGVEVLVGVWTDDRLGPILTVGLGGVFAEIAGDVVQRPVPVTPNEARQMLDALRSAKMFDGARGSRPVSRSALVALMVAVSGFAQTRREDSLDIDLNPVVVHPDGVWVVDTVIRWDERR